MLRVEIVTYYKVVVIITKFSQLVIPIWDWTLYGKWTRNKPLAYWESKQYYDYLRIFRPSVLCVDVFKHATLPIGIGTIMHRGPVSISCNISSFWKVMFTNLMLHLCQSDFLCRCQMYPFNAFYVTYGGNYKRYPSVFDLRAYRLAFQWLWHVYDYVYDYCSMYIWPFFSCFDRGKCRLLYIYIYISLKDPIFNFSLQPGSGGKPFPDILCDCCYSWAQHNIMSLAIRHPTSTSVV